VTIQSPQDIPLRKSISKLLVKTVNQFNHLPSSLCVNGVRVHSREPIASGGFGEVFKGTYQGKEVALKRLRAYGVHQDRIVLNEACSSLSFHSFCTYVYARDSAGKS
jgi:hypothetical protein